MPRPERGRRVSKPFADRADAGRVLAEELAPYAGSPDVIVLGLPRGGIPVAYEVACALGAPLDVFVVRKLGAPGQEELAMGAIASGDVVVLNDEVIEALKISPDELKAEIENEGRELERRESIYRGGRALAAVKGKIVILVDDGLATGSTMRAAVAALRRQGPAQIVVAVPVGASSTCAEFEEIADRCICAIAPDQFRSVGLWYEDFEQTDDDEVCNLLARAAALRLEAQEHQAGSGGVRKRQDVSQETQIGASQARHQRVNETEVAIVAGTRALRGTLCVPHGAAAVIVFAHGSGSGRHSPRNQYVAHVLQQAGLGTLLIDLLEEDEANDRSNVFDIGLLAGRLQAAAVWLTGQPETASLRLGYFGASTGAAAALTAAAHRAPSIGAIVSRGGRPDLAFGALPQVTAPCLFIVGGNDQQVLELNRQAFERLTCPRQLVVVPGATHLFPEPGALEEVARLAKEWFLQYL
jgi:putative phosphoribosyl transferase